MQTQTDPELKAIVDRMIAAGEPEEAIGQVIRHWTSTRTRTAATPTPVVETPKPSSSGYSRLGEFGTGIVEGVKQGGKSLFNLGVGAIKAGNPAALIDVAPADTELPESKSGFQTAGRFLGRTASELPAYAGVSGVVRGVAAGAAESVSSQFVKKLLTGSVPGSFWKSAAASVPLNIAEGAAGDALMHPETFGDPMSLAVSTALGSTGAIFDGFRGARAGAAELKKMVVAGVRGKDMIERVDAFRKQFNDVLNADPLQSHGLAPKVELEKPFMLGAKEWNPILRKAQEMPSGEETAYFAAEGKKLWAKQASIVEKINNAMDDMQHGTSLKAAERLEGLFTQLENVRGDYEKFVQPELARSVGSQTGLKFGGGEGDAVIRFGDNTEPMGGSTSRALGESHTQRFYPTVNAAQGDNATLALSGGGRKGNPPANPSVITGGDDPLGSLLHRAEPVEDKYSWRRLDQELFDRAAPLKELSDPKDANSAYALSRRLAGINGQVGLIQNEKVFIPKGDTYVESTGPTMRSLMEFVGLSSETRSDWSKYLLGDSGYEFGLDKTKVAAQMAELNAKYPHFKDAVKLWDAKRLDIAKTAEGYEAITPDQVPAFMESLKYVPTSRAVTGGGEPLGFLKAKTNTASLRPIIDPQAQLFQNERDLIRFGEKQKMYRKMIAAVREKPEVWKGRLELVNEVNAEAPVERMMAEIAGELKAQNLPVPSREVLRAHALIRSESILDETAPSRLVWEKGVPVQLRIKDPAIMAYFESIKPLDLGRVLGTARNIEKGATALFFQPLREMTGLNAAIDQFEAFSNTRWSEFVPMWDTMKGIYAQAVGDPRLNTIRVNRGDISTRYADAHKFNDAATYDQFIEDAQRKGISAYKSSPIDAIHKLLGVIQSGTRMGAALRKLEATGDGAQAARMSRDVIPDPQQVGSSQAVKYLSLASFANYALQSNRRVFQAAMDNPGTFASKVAVGVTLPTIGLWYANKDDEDIQRLRKSKGGYNYWYVRNPQSQEIYTIQKPYIAGVLGGTMVEAALDHDRVAAETLGKALWDHVIPNPIPITVGLAAESVFGKNYFGFMGGSVPLVPTGRAGALPEDAAGLNTFGFSKDIAEKLRRVQEKSGLPVSIDAGIVDNVIKTILFSQGSGIADRVDRMIYNRTAPEAGMTPFPMTKKVNPNRSNTQPLNEFYDMYHEASRVNKSLDIALNNAQGPRAQQLLDENKEAIKKFVMLDALNDVFGTINEQIRFTDENQTLSPTERRERINKLRALMIDKADAMNKMVR